MDLMVPLDGSVLAEQVLPYVRVLGKGFQSRIFLLQVIEPVQPELVNAGNKLQLDRLAMDSRLQASDYLDAIAAGLRGLDLEVETSVVGASPASQILEMAERDPQAIIAMSTHGRSGLIRYLLGSVTDKVLHASTNPLLVIRPDEVGPVAHDAPINNLLLPLDGSRLAEQALPLAVAVASALHLDITLVRAIPSAWTYYSGEYPVGLVSEDMDRAVEASAIGYLQTIAKTLRTHPVGQVKELVQRGNSATVVMDAAQELPNSMVIMTTHGHSDIGRWVLGSVTDRVVRHSGRPVLIIRSADQGQ